MNEYVLDSPVLNLTLQGRYLYDYRDGFNFPNVNFPFICRNIPAAPAYGEYILIRYPRACGSYHDFFDRVMVLKVIFTVLFRICN
jgi:hypothetical protein